MNKIKDLKGIISWCDKYKDDNIITDKLDGLSGLLIITFNNSKIQQIELFSRGNGTFGRNLNHLLKYIDLPNKSRLEKYAHDNNLIEIAVRGELYVKRKI